MIVRHFLQWVRNGSPGERADATAALARAYLYSDLSPDDRAAAEGAMLLLLDDTSPLVRQTLAESLATSYDAPPAIVHALASDQAEIAALVLSRSPLLLDADLVDWVGGGTSATQCAIASRVALPCSVAAAIAEVGSAEACLIVLENPTALVAPFSFDRIIARHGHLAAVREALFARDDLPMPARQALVTRLSQTLAGFVTSRAWLDEERAQRIAREACDKATVALAATAPASELGPLVSHLRQSGQLTAGLILRALLSGNMTMFEEALCELSELPPARVAQLIYDRTGKGLRAVCERAGLPLPIVRAVWAAMSALNEYGYAGEMGGTSRLRRSMVERALTYCEDADQDGSSDALLVLLRRFSLEAAREEARLYCDELAAA
jgi:uncharacterized protein (DUF2336 family)